MVPSLSFLFSTIEAHDATTFFEILFQNWQVIGAAPYRMGVFKCPVNHGETKARIGFVGKFIQRHRLKRMECFWRNQSKQPEVGYSAGVICSGKASSRSWITNAAIPGALAARVPATFKTLIPWMLQK